MIKFRFVADPWDFLHRFRPSRSLFCRQNSETIFVESPPAFQGAVAHFDVVLLAAGKIIQRERVFVRANHAQITLDPGSEPRAGLGRAFCNDRFDKRVTSEKLRDGFRLLGRNNEVQIAHYFPAPTITTSNVDMERVGVRGQIIFQSFGFTRDLAELK